MANQAYKDWYVQGLQALKSASDQGRDATGGSTQGLGSPELKAMMEDGTHVLAQQSDLIAQLLKKAGGDATGMPNTIMQGILAGTRQMVETAKDPAVRDASIIGAAQIACHYYIAAYGTLASTAKHLGLTDDARQLKQMVDEMKTGDERFTALAESMVNKQAQAAN